MHFEDFREAEQLDDFEDALGHVEQLDVAALLSRLLGKADERTQTSTADVIKIPAVQKHGVLVLLEKGTDLRLEAWERIHIERAGQANHLDVAAGVAFDAKIFHACLLVAARNCR